MGQLSSEEVTWIDPRRIGADPAILQLFQSYPLPNDFTQGDTLNTAGYRFHAPTPLRWNTYIAKFDYQLDQNGKHRIFWRGNLQNDNFAHGVPEVPSPPASTQLLPKSK